MTAPRLPDAPGTYDAGYMSRLLSSLRTYFTQLDSVRHLNVATQNFDLGTLPVSATGLRDGDVYADGDVLKVKGLAGGGVGAHTHPWSDITGTPTTVAGYGITDFNSLGDARWLQLTGGTLSNLLTVNAGAAQAVVLNGIVNFDALYAYASVNGYGGGLRAVNDHAGGSAYTLVSAQSNAGATYIGALSTAAGAAGLVETTLASLYLRTLTSAPIYIATNNTIRATVAAATGVFDFVSTPTVGGTTVALSTHNHTGVYQPLDTDLTNIAALTGTSGFLKTNGAGTWSVDTATYLTANQSITLSGDISGTGATAITTAIGANKVTNAMLAQVATATFKGRTTAATGNVEDLTVAQAAALLNSTIAPAWGNITSKPTTISGYGITDFNSLGDARWLQLTGGTLSGNLGVGAAATAWGSGYNGVAVGSGANALFGSTTTGEWFLTSNTYFDGTNYKYSRTAAAMVLSAQTDGSLLLRTAPSGTAGTSVTLTQRMLINNDGNVTVGGSFTPQAWKSNFRAIEIGSAANALWAGTDSRNVWLSANAYYDSGNNFKYAATDGAWALNIGPGNGNFSVHRAASGTAGGTITWITHLAIDSTGLTKLNAGATSDEVLRLDSLNSTYLSWYRSGARKSYIQSDPGGLYIVQEELQPAFIYTNSLLSFVVNGDGGFRSRANNKSGLVRSQDFYTWNTTDNLTGRYVHLKTNIPLNDTMWQFQFEGYAYGTPATISARLCAYPYSGGGTIVSIASSGTHTCSAYLSGDGYMVLTIYLNASYYAGFTLSSIQANPPAVFASPAITAATHSASATGVY